MNGVKEVVGNILIIEAAGVLQEIEFFPVEAQITNQIRQFAKVKILVDGRGLDGLADIAAAQALFSFLRKYHDNIEKLALIVDDTWMKIAASLADGVIEGEISVFDVAHAKAARRWIHTESAPNG